MAAQRRVVGDAPAAGTVELPALKMAPCRQTWKARKEKSRQGSQE